MDLAQFSAINASAGEPFNSCATGEANAPVLACRARIVNYLDAHLSLSLARWAPAIGLRIRSQAGIGQVDRPVADVAFWPDDVGADDLFVASPGTVGDSPDRIESRPKRRAHHPLQASARSAH